MKNKKIMKKNKKKKKNKKNKKIMNPTPSKARRS